ncbi:Crp/Fnr family transcriptional regulator [Gelidibacter sp. F63206]|uniref:Crp/Fnr family transcriptional regulator n=1 Tax=Gelidibacter sp. F63206 TaxID=2926425 RepID=UPI001FF36921|nr:Crp/Fnr family transcriptional regulator [Gelidibacter sp. F63206]MCK0114595.1 Crp/Fnr family transcriptional regulator [Gelidibacter sp. F63206]
MKLDDLPLEEELKTEIGSTCRTIIVEKSAVLAESGKYMKVIPLVLDGSIRVYRNDYDLDREILLYYIASGQTCMMSLVASFSDMKSQVHAIAERKSELLLVPTTKVREWQINYPKWNDFIIHTFLNRYTELLNTINDLSFKNIDERLYNYLIQYHHRQGDDKVSLTHKKLANELGTTRVVISRLLKDLEKKNVVELRRGEIILKGQ